MWPLWKFLDKLGIWKGLQQSVKSQAKAMFCCFVGMNHSLLNRFLQWSILITRTGVVSKSSKLKHIRYKSNVKSKKRAIDYVDRNMKKLEKWFKKLRCFCPLSLYMVCSTKIKGFALGLGCDTSPAISSYCLSLMSSRNLCSVGIPKICKRSS